MNRQAIRLSKAQKPLQGDLVFPGDKSLSHRAIIFGALAEGVSHFKNVLTAEDCLCTRKAFEAMGVRMETPSKGELKITGCGKKPLKAPSAPIDLGNSGTSLRLLLGILAGQRFSATLTGDASLTQRPMRRVTDYLKQMGAKIEGRDGANFAPLTIRGGPLKGIEARLEIASAQVKSALLLAGLFAEGRTVVVEPARSRDHTERFLAYFGAEIERRGLESALRGGQTLKAKSFKIPGDISSAAFFMAAGLLVPGSKVRFRSVLWNPTRTGMVRLLKKMGVKLDAVASDSQGPEPVADFTVTPQPLKAFEVTGDELPSCIDEIPILAVLATQARGRSVIHDAKELRVKETDRIHSMVSNLKKMGARIESRGDTLVIEGPTPLRGAQLQSFGDHRSAMALAVAGLLADGASVVEGAECVNTSYPEFFQSLKRVGGSFETLTL